MIEGRWKVIGKAIAAGIGVKGRLGNDKTKFGRFVKKHLGNYEEYKWSELGNLDKLAIVDFGVTILSMLTMYAAYLVVFKDSDDEDPYARLATRIGKDFSQQYNPIELFRQLANATPVTAKVGWQTFDAGATLTYSTLMYSMGYEDDAFTAKGDLKGSNQAARVFPLSAPFYDIHKLMEEGKDSPFWDIIPMTTRR